MAHFIVSLELGHLVHSMAQRVCLNDSPSLEYWHEQNGASGSYVRVIVLVSRWRKDVYSNPISRMVLFYSNMPEFQLRNAWGVVNAPPSISMQRDSYRQMNL